MNKHHLDARNLLCPLPVIRVQDQVKTMQVGDELEVACTDPGVLNDVPAWCRINGHMFLRSDEKDHEFILTIQVGAP